MICIRTIVYCNGATGDTAFTCFIPDEVRARAEAAGVNIDDFTIAMDFENHVGSKVGIHHMFAPDEIDELTGVVKKSAFVNKYNQQWIDFFKDEDGNELERSPKEIFDFAQKMVKKIGSTGCEDEILQN